MKPIYYLRTSSKDQNPDLQKKEGMDFCKENHLEKPEIYIEQGSAYKIEKVRPIWNEVIEKAKKEKRDILVWRYDRSFRNRKEFYKFMKIMFEVYNLKVYSVKEPSILAFWKMMNQTYSDNPIFNELISNLFKALWDFMIQQAGEEAEEESRRKGERVKLAVKKDKGITKSYKGKRWGRKQLPKSTINHVQELFWTGLSVRKIAERTFYWTKQGKKNISKSSVQKILAENIGKNYMEIRRIKIDQFKDK